MAKNSLYNKLVQLFKSAINNDQEVKSEFDFTKIKKIILNQKKDNRYYRGIQQFLAYLIKYRDKNALIFIFHESEKKNQRFLEIVNSLEKRLPDTATAVKKSNFKSLVIQPFLTMLFFLQLFTKQIITARPLEASRQTRSTNNCVIEDPHCYQYNDNLDITKYQVDLQKSPGFSEILNRKQSIEFKFSNTIFILSGNCISRQGIDNNFQSLCRSDYSWFLKSMAIYLIGKKVRAEALEQRLSQQNDAAFAQITQDICSIDPIQQNDRQLMGIYSHGTTLENINEFELGKFIFNAEYLLNEFFSERNSSNLVSRVDQAVRLKIAELKNLEPEESKVFTSLNRDHYSRSLPETQSAISDVLQTDINTIPSNYHRSAEGFNWKIIAPVVVVGIGIIVSIVGIIIRYRKKFKSGNSESGMELSPLINSIPDNLHVLQIAGRLTKRLEFLKDLSRYDSEIGSHYISFCNADSKEKAIEDLKVIKEALTKFLASKRSSNKNKDKILSNKLESALLIVESLMQRYYLLSLPNPNTSKNNYITEQLKYGLRDLINSMISNIEIIRDSYKGPYKTKKDELKYLNLLLNLEKAIYETMLSAHAEGYFEEYPREQIKTCLELNPNTNTKDNHESDLKKIKELQGDLLSTIGFILNSSKSFVVELLKLNKHELYNAINSFITKLEAIKSQLIAYFADRNARWDEASKLKQLQASIGSVNLTFFGQSPSVQISQPTSEYTMHR
ncbi:MAG TPA: hypothetical protein VGH95_02860 [Candidatus Aquirickettsiella sp.]|jgi:hypothetical protein